ncbi:MAG: DUF4250 domain-containing protein [Lachnospiraceae bacterium]|jgi:hypothetical protein|nr:DUF4250 domain-containing protein [Lachnospiraceae bacterium]
MSIPKDPIMLLSYVNTQLRDFYPTLEDMCNSLDINQSELVEKLREVSYEYNKDLNKFI